MATKQEKTDREQAASFFDGIKTGMPLASKGAVDDSTSGEEALWLSVAEGEMKINNKAFTAAGGAGASGTRTIAANWKYVDIQWLVKVRHVQHAPHACMHTRELTATLHTCASSSR